MKTAFLSILCSYLQFVKNYEKTFFKIVLLILGQFYFEKDLELNKLMNILKSK